MDAEGQVDRDDFVAVLGAIPMPSLVGPPLDPDAARRLEERRVYVSRAERERQVAARREARDAAVDEVQTAVEDAIESDRLAGMTNEGLADLIVHRNAKIVLLGGPLFQPTSLKEATEAARVWSKVAVDEANRRRGRLPDEPEADPVSEAAARLATLQKVAIDRKRLQMIKGTG